MSNLNLPSSVIKFYYQGFVSLGVSSLQGRELLLSLSIYHALSLEDEILCLPFFSLEEEIFACLKP